MGTPFNTTPRPTRGAGALQEVFSEGQCEPARFTPLDVAFVDMAAGRVVAKSFYDARDPSRSRQWLAPLWEWLSW
jgi:hypothetical protein